MFLFNKKTVKFGHFSEEKTLSPLTFFFSRARLYFSELTSGCVHQNTFNPSPERFHSNFLISNAQKIQIH